MEIANKPKIVYRYQVRNDGVQYNEKNQPEICEKTFDSVKEMTDWRQRQNGHPWLYIHYISTRYVDENGYNITEGRFRQLTEKIS